MAFNKLFLTVFLFLALINLNYAYYLPAHYFSHFNVSVANYSNLIIGANTNSSATLTVISTLDYYNYYNGYPFSTIYNKTLTASNITTVTVSKGYYTVILKARSTPINYTFDVATVPVGKGQFITVNGRYTYNLNLSNYSKVNILLVSLKNIDINASTYSNYTMNPYSDNNEYNWTLHFDAGRQSFTFKTKQPDRIFLLLNTTPALANPLDFLNGSNPYSRGVASYGLYNISNTLVPYEIKTDAVEGYANITALSAYNAMPPENISQYGASLQLNVMLKLKAVTGKTYAYWLQDVMQFNTSENNYTIIDNIWNATGTASKLSNVTLSGGGIVNAYAIKSNQTYYVTVAKITPYSYTQHYTFPLYFTPMIKVKMKNSLPVVMFGYKTNSGIRFYDNVTVNLPSSEASILTTPYYRTPANASGGVSQFYDTELVFCGYASAESTRFNNLSAKVWIYYDDNNGILRAFPSVYTFGADTGEAATHVAVSSLPNGLALVSTGANNNTKTLVLQGTQVITIPPSVPTTLPTTYSTTTIYGTTVPGQTNATTGQNGSTSATTTDLLIGVAGLIIAVVLLIYIPYKLLHFIYRRIFPKKEEPTKPENIKGGRQ